MFSTVTHAKHPHVKIDELSIGGIHYACVDGVAVVPTIMSNQLAQFTHRYRVSPMPAPVTPAPVTPAPVDADAIEENPSPEDTPPGDPALEDTTGTTDDLFGNPSPGPTGKTDRARGRK